MRYMLATVDMQGMVVIGEGEKDEAPMLYNGEQIGTGTGAEVDVAVDPLEGTELVARGQPNALAVVAAAEKGRCSTPAPSLHGEARLRRRHRRGDRPARPDRGDAASWSPRPSAVASAT